MPLASRNNAKAQVAQIPVLHGVCFVLFFKNKKSGGKTEKEKKKENQTSSMTQCCFSYLIYKFFPNFSPKMIGKWKKTRKEALSTQMTLRKNFTPVMVAREFMRPQTWGSAEQGGHLPSAGMSELGEVGVGKAPVRQNVLQASTTQGGDNLVVFFFFLITNIFRTRFLHSNKK